MAITQIRSAACALGFARACSQFSRLHGFAGIWRERDALHMELLTRLHDFIAGDGGRGLVFHLHGPQRGLSFALVLQRVESLVQFGKDVGLLLLHYFLPFCGYRAHFMLQSLGLWHATHSA